MALFDFLKKKKKISETPSPVKAADIKQEYKNLKKKVYSEHDKVRESLLNLSEDFKERVARHTEILEKVDLSDKKEEDKVKRVVKGSVNGFIDHLNRLIMKINQIFDDVDEKKTAAQLQHATNKALADFETKSYASYEKATYLVGDEMADVLKTINSFSREMKQVMDTNKQSIERLAEITSIEQMKKNVKYAKKEVENIDENISNAEKRMKELHEEIQRLKSRKEEIQDSDKYKQMTEKKNELSKTEKEISSMIDSLSKEVDLKELAKRWHSSNKKMNIIKRYRSNFKEEFRTDLGEELISLHDENIEKNIIDEIKKVQSLDKKKKELTESIDVQDPIEEINSDIAKYEESIKSIKELNSKLKETKSEKEKIVNSMKEEIIKRVKSIV
ncbi:MAG: hypothetical protein ACOCUR_01850 [Nanoarchaeota archaeon]